MVIFSVRLARLLFWLTLVTVGGCRGKTSSSSLRYQFEFLGHVKAPEAVVAGDDVIHFTLKWSEDANGAITGVYTDNHFAQSPASLTGTFHTDGTREMTIKLASAVNSATKLDLAMMSLLDEASDVLVITSFAGKDAQDAVVFDRRNVSAETRDAKKREGADAFFATNAGVYEYYAGNTESKTDPTFEHGKKYKFTVTVDKKITFEMTPSLETTFGADANDTYDKYDDEEVVSLSRNGANITFHHQFADDSRYFSYEDMAVIVYWVFTEKPTEKPAPTVLR